MKEPSSIVISNNEVKPGEHKVVYIPMPNLYNSAPLTMPVHVYNGKQSGPCLLITAAIHGDEINGVDIIRRLLKSKLLKHLAGTIIAVPVANIYGFLNQSRYLMDRRDLNRTFPGSEWGSLTSRLAYLIMQELVTKANLIIDLHTGSLHRSNLPQIRITLDDEQVLQLAKSFHAPVILNTRSPEGSLRQAAKNLGIPTLLYEAGEALRFDEECIRIGVQGILNVMRELHMLPRGHYKGYKEELLIVAHSSLWVRAPHSGIIRSLQHLGNKVQAGDILGYISDPVGLDEKEVVSPIKGIIIGQNNIPMIHEGDALFHIAGYEKINLENINTKQTRAVDDPENPLIEGEMVIIQS